MPRSVAPGATDQSEYFYIVEDVGGTSPGEPKTGLTHSNLDSAYYTRTRDTATQITPLSTLAAANSSHADGGFKEVDATNQPGIYRFDPPDAAYASGAAEVVIALKVAGASNAIARPIKVHLDDGSGLTEAGGTGDHLTALASQTSVNTIDDLLDTEIAALTTELAKVPKSDGTASWNATALAAIQSECNDALVAYDPPTKAELDAADDAVLAAIAALNDIAATDIVSGGAITTSGGAVSTVTNLTTKTGFKLASDGLDLVVPSDPSAIPVLGTASIVTLIGWFGAWSLNEVDSDADSVNLRNSADTADLAAYASSDDGTTFVSGEAT